jgi:hypothetical protein
MGEGGKMKPTFVAVLVTFCFCLQLVAQADKNNNEYVPKQYASVNEALAALKDCGAEVPKGLCDDFTVDYLAKEYWKGNNRILIRIMEIVANSKHLMGAPAEAASWFLGDVMVKDTLAFLNALAMFPPDLQRDLALNATEMAPISTKQATEMLTSYQSDKKLGQAATICLLAIEIAQEEEKGFELRESCEKRPPLAPAGGKIWGMDCATKKLFIGDYYTNQEVTILISDQTAIIGSKGGKLACTDMKPGDRVHVWPKIKTEGVLYNTKPVEALVVVVEN